MSIATGTAKTYSRAPSSPMPTVNWLTPAELARGPLAGGVWAVEAGVRGLPEPRCGG